MKSDESTVRELLLAAQQQPALLDPRDVLARGRRRLWRNRVAPAVGLLLVAAFAGGVVVVTQQHHGPPGVARNVSVVPGEIERLDVADLTFGVAARHKNTRQGPVPLGLSPERNRRLERGLRRRCHGSTVGAGHLLR